jgi:hypothetical protein
LSTPPPSPFLLIFPIGSNVFAWGWSQTWILLPTLSTSWDSKQVCTTIADIFVGMGILLTFCLGWPRVAIFLISASWVEGIIGVSHHAQP